MARFVGICDSQIHGITARREQTDKKEKRRRLRLINLDVLLEQILWEYSHEKVNENAAKKEAKNAHEEGDAPDDDQNERKTMLEKCYGEINVLISKFLSARKEMREILPKGEGIRLTGKAFYDLERMVGYMTLGWAEDKSRGKYTRCIIEEALDSQRMQLGN